jgi:hypothetical protein
VGFRKLGNYQRGQSKTDTYYDGAGAWLGAGAVDSEGKTAKTSDVMARGIETSLASGQTSVDDIAEYHSMLIRDKESATDANKLEIQKQIDAIESVRPIGDPAAIARGEPSELAVRLNQNKQEYRPTTIDPSEREPK